MPFALAGGELEPEVQVHIARSHADLLDLLRTALAGLGVPDVATATALVAGAVRSAAELLREGAASELVLRTTERFVIAGIQAL